MISSETRLVGSVLLLLTPRPGSAQGAQWVDPSPHSVSFVTVEDGVRLEVLDWGGTGPPLILLAGLSMTAHVFDEFAPELTRSGHAYGITRRGFGASDKPDHGYDAERLADDVLAVASRLALTDPILIGHSIAGRELSAIAARHPKQISGVVYLDGISNGFLPTDVREAIQALPVPLSRPPQTPQPQASDLESFDALRSYMGRFQGYGPPESQLRQMFATNPDGSVGAYRVDRDIVRAINADPTRYEDVGVPALVMMALPAARPPWTYDLAAADQAVFEDVGRWGDQRQELIAVAVEQRVPSARVVRIPGADHNMYGSNPRQVLEEITSFVTSLR